MNVHWLIVVVLIALSGCSSPDRSSSLLNVDWHERWRDPDGWFARIATRGSNARDLEVFAWFQHKAKSWRGSAITDWVQHNPLVASQVAADPEFHKTINPTQQYWFWTAQGPRTDRQMFIITAGRDLPTSSIVYVKIQERPCF